MAGSMGGSLANAATTTSATAETAPKTKWRQYTHAVVPSVAQFSNRQAVLAGFSETLKMLVRGEKSLLVVLVFQ